MSKSGEDNGSMALKAYVKFLNEEKLHEVGVAFLKLLREEDLSVLKHFSHFTPEDLLQKYCRFLRECFNEILENKLLEKIALKINQWGTSQLSEDTAKTFDFADILLLASLTQQAMQMFLSEYVPDSKSSTAIALELQKLFLKGRKKLVQAHVEIQQQTLHKKESTLRQYREELQGTNEELRTQTEALQVTNEELNAHFLQLEEAQIALKENESRLIEAQKIAGLGSWEYDLIANKIYWSDEMKKIFGYSSDEALAYETYIHLLHPDDRERVKSIVSTTLETNVPYSFEHKIIRKDGSVRHVLANGYTVLSEENKLLKLRGTGWDITALKTVELENRESQNFINKVAETTPDVITVFDLVEKKNIYTNKELDVVLGYTLKEVNIIKGKGLEGLKEIFHPEDFPRMIRFLIGYQQYTGDETKEIEYRIKHKKGNWIWVIGRYNIFKRGSEGFPKQIIGISRNITKRKLSELTLRESEKRLKDAQTMAHLGYWELDVQTKKVFWSDELYDIFQLPPQSEINLELVLAQILPDDRKLLRLKIQDSIEKAEPYSIQYRIDWPNGGVRFLVTNGAPFRDEEGIIREVKGFTQDVTDQKVVEQKLQKAYEELKKAHYELKQSEETLKLFNNELEQRVSQRTKELLESNDSLLRKNADLDNFIYTASHDLKVPIANIEGLLSIFKNKVNDKLQDHEKIVLNMMQESIERFNVTIKDLTQISKMQKDMEEETQEEISIFEVLNDLTADMADLIGEKKAIINIDFKVREIFFSKKNLRSVLFNLINNALKYSSTERVPNILIQTRIARDFDMESNNKDQVDSNRGKEIDAANGSKQNKAFFMLKVQDNGLGIPENQSKKIFSLFKRYHTHTEGSGIGLYIVKRIVENNGGKIEVESKVDFGTTFKLFFPYFSRDESKV